MKITYDGARSYFLFTCLACLLTASMSAFAGDEASSGTASPAMDVQSKVESEPKSEAAQPDGKGEGSASGKSEPDSSAAASSAADSSTSAASADQAPRPALRKRRVPVGLGPGQKYKITGFAEQQPTTIVDDKSSQPASYHRAQMRATGSMCYACLLELQEKMLEVFGVERFRAAKSEQVSLQSYTADLSNWADVIVYYDASKVSFADLRAYIRSSGYYPYKIVDKEVSSVPPEEQKKI